MNSPPPPLISCRRLVVQRRRRKVCSKHFLFFLSSSSLPLASRIRDFEGESFLMLLNGWSSHEKVKSCHMKSLDDTWKEFSSLSLSLQMVIIISARVKSLSGLGLPVLSQETIHSGLESFIVNPHHPDLIHLFFTFSFPSFLTLMLVHHLISFSQSAFSQRIIHSNPHHILWSWTHLAVCRKTGNKEEE